jgi:hypothetical protein
MEARSDGIRNEEKKRRKKRKPFAKSIRQRSHVPPKNNQKKDRLNTLHPEVSRQRMSRTKRKKKKEEKE